jgi:hypothetical protein
VSASVPWSNGESQTALAIRTTSVTSAAAGRSRRARRAQNFVRETVPVAASSSRRRPEMRKPERTKKTSTPRKPARAPRQPAC